MALSQGAGGSLAENTERPVLRLAEWLRRQDQDISSEIWQAVVDVARQTRDRRAQLRACALLADRIDPVAQPVPIAASAAGVSVTILAASDAALPDVQAHGWTLHVGGGNGAPAGNGHAG